MSKILFVHIPKAAGGSIVKWAKQNNIENFINAEHRPLLKYLELYPNTDICKSFTITRNTYHRMLSLYNFAKNKHYKVLKQVKSGKRILTDLEIKYTKEFINAWDKGIVYYLDFVLNYNFEHHNQLSYIQNVDLIITYNHLNKDFNKIQQLTNCYAPLTQQVHTYKEKAVIDMSTDYIKCIQKHFAEELDFFQYTP